MEIEENVPLPPDHHPRLDPERLALFDRMRIGDSVLWPSDNPRDSRHAVYAMRHGRKRNRGYVCRRVDGGFRIWRTR